jgi:hypothetical protein
MKDGDEFQTPRVYYKETADGENLRDKMQRRGLPE